MNPKCFPLLATQSSPRSYPHMASLWSTPSTRMDIAMSSQRQTHRCRVLHTMMTFGLVNLSQLIYIGLSLGLKCYLHPKTEVSGSEGYGFVLTETDPQVQSVAYDDDFWIGKPIPAFFFKTQHIVWGVHYIVVYLQVEVYHIVTYDDCNVIGKCTSGVCMVCEQYSMIWICTQFDAGLWS